MFDNLKKIMKNQKGIIEANKAQTILIVEDNEVDRQLITKILGKEGYSTLTAVNGELGLSLAKEEIPDLIVLDCDMPVMGGIEMCKRIKNYEATKGIPVIFLTSVKTPQNIINCFELDAENYLSKPISSKILISEVNQILKTTSPTK